MDLCLYRSISSGIVHIFSDSHVWFASRANTWRQFQRDSLPSHPFSLVFMLMTSMNNLKCCLKLVATYATPNYLWQLETNRIHQFTSKSNHLYWCFDEFQQTRHFLFEELRENEIEWPGKANIGRAEFMASFFVTFMVLVAPGCAGNDYVSTDRYVQRLHQTEGPRGNCLPVWRESLLDSPRTKPANRQKLACDLFIMRTQKLLNQMQTFALSSFFAFF